MKRALSVFSVLLFALIASASNTTIRYFLTELDFRSNQPVPESEVRYKDYISAEYENNNIIKKLYVNRRGETTRAELFLYDSTNTLKSTNVYLPNDQLVRQILFGLEEKAVEYIEYVYGVDTVKDWTDRFSILDFNEESLLKSHGFFDVNAFRYGHVEFEYDSTGRLTHEAWVRHPAGKTMRWWDHIFDPETQLTRIMEFDSNGVLVQDFQLSPDGTESIFWYTELVDSLFINHTNLHFKNVSKLEWGSLTWYEVDTGEVFLDSIEIFLPKNMLKEGTFAINMELDSLLNDSAMYNVVFNGKGKSGYDATQRSVLGLTYDVSSPILSIGTKPYINEPIVQFDQSEPLITAQLTWIDISDSAKIIVTEFDSLDLTKAGSRLFRPSAQADLQDSTFYRLSFIGTDRATNVSKPTIIDSILYDIRKPVTAMISPYNGEYRNITTISFSIDEPIQSWDIAVKSMGGEPDPESPYYYQADSSLYLSDTVYKELSDEFLLNDGTKYYMEVRVIDRAGNQSESTSVDSVTYDITPPVITTIYPPSGSAINVSTISYSNNEQLRAGEFRWEQTEGTMDSSAPHIIELIPSELEQGDHIQVLLSNQTELTDGTLYSLMFVAQDLAGNEGIAPPNTEILYDAVPPEFTDVLPVKGNALNHQHVSYTLSEKVASGTITWTWTGGIKDGATPHIVELIEDEQNRGEHDSLLLAMNPPLVDGGIYTLEFSAADRAGNTAEIIVVENVLYDFTAPVMTVTYPASMLFLPKKNFTYTLSETLEEGAFLLERKGGKDDSRAPHKIPLSTKEKSSGEHQDIELLTMPEVVEGTIYKLSFSGRDRAKNYTAPISMPGIQYDFTPPILTLNTPFDSTDVNHLLIDYHFNEIMLEANAIWEHTGGLPDPKERHIQALIDIELEEGIHAGTTLLNSPLLVDGAVYSISLSGKDRAGNESNIPIVKDILYDITPPAIALTDPKERTYVSTPSITYTLSEKLQKGIITYMQSGGQIDTLSPQEISMDLSLRQSGIHENIFEVEGVELTEGSIYTISISGKDRAGNEGSVASISGIIYDATPPLLTITTPDSTLAVNHNRISFTKSENLESGKIIWTATGGIPDPGSPHTAKLIDLELKKDPSENIKLSNAPVLHDGTIYSISFSAIDFAGNTSETVIMENVLYDISPPILQIVSPGDNHYTMRTELTFVQSEDLDFGQIKWDGINEENEPLSTTWELNEAARFSGDHVLNNYHEPVLIDGGDYSIQFEGRDPAGNEAVPVKIVHYKVDRTPPKLTNLNPANGSYVNLDEVGFTLSENIESAIVLFSSNNDEKKISLQSDEMKEGIHPLGRLKAQEPLLDGEVYTIAFFGIDFAGNKSDTVTIEELTYDISPPKFTVKSPLSNSYINSSELIITINEQLQSGQIIWEPGSGSLILDSLKTNHLLPEEHTVAYEFNLEENIPYSIIIRGMDLAGNTGESEFVVNVLYDITPPEISFQSPEANDVVNHVQVSYSINEDLSSANMFWQDISEKDPEPVHESELKETERLQGQYIDLEITRSPKLFDGAEYMLRLEGTDLAGNTANAEAVPSFKYDITPPEFSHITPPSGSLINEANIAFTNSEDIDSGKITFTRVLGAEDLGSPYVVNLVGSHLKEGQRGGKLPESIVRLTNGSVYSIEFFGKDFAGNMSSETRIDSIRFDNEPPVVFLKSPSSKSYTNSLAIDFLISEDLAAGNLDIKIKDDKKFSIELDEAYRKAGEYSQFLPKELLDLNDGIELNMSLTGIDAAGNEATPYKLENIKYDTTHPSITILKPSADDFINYTSISYELSENIKEAYLNVIQMGGVLDSKSPHRIQLSGNELKEGKKENIQLKNGPILMNGSIYSFEFSGNDFADNEVQSTKISNITYDNEPPSISLSRPIDSEQIKNSEISYILSDNLSKGVVIFKNTGGTTDPALHHEVELKGSQLRQGTQMNIDMLLMDALADGGRYSISIQGWDKAGNASEKATVKDVLFDVLPPNLAIHEPKSGSAFNEPIISFEMNEKLAEGTLTFSRTGGGEDINSPHEVLILPPFNDQGRHDGISLANDVTLKDGSVYEITFNARDPAGNVSAPVKVENILYDISPPTITADSPSSGSFLQNLKLQFSVDEQLANGEITVEYLIGTADQNSPHVIPLQESQLLLGSHEVLAHELTTLVSGAGYNVFIKGKDRAGNSAIPGEVGQLHYDIEPPVITIHSPNTGQKVNHTIVGFSIGEKLQDLTIKWAASQAEEQNIILPKKYFLPDQYNQVVLPEPPELVSGENYSIHLAGTDMAGNIAETQIDNIEYDITPPTFKTVSPQNGSFQNHTNIVFTITEPLKEGQIIWNAIGGTTDPLSPRSIELSSDELVNGMSTPASLTNQTALQDGSIYQLSINGIDLAGNEGSADLANDIHFDISPPVIQLLSPDNDAYVNHDNIEFSNSENLKSGKITWSRSGGGVDPTKHEVNMKEGVLASGTHNTGELQDLPLVSMVDYKVEITGIDLAGNSTTATSSRTFHYDTTPPALTILEPQSDAFINHLNVAYTLSEPLQSGIFQFKNQTSSAVGKTMLQGNELTTLNWESNPLSSPLAIVDGGTYTYKMVGTDLAGNTGESVEITNIRYDISKPVFTITRPLENYVNVESITSYYLNEDIVSGTATWVRTGGKILGPVATANRPQIMELNGNEMLEGDHKNILFTNSPQLNATTVYKLTLQGIDLAGNESLPTSVDGIAFIPALSGNWFFQGAIMTVVWSFEPDEGVDDQSKGTFSQGIQMGTKISNQEYGKYTVDYSKTPWEMVYVMDKSGQQRFSIFEFRDNLHMKVLTKDRKKPKNWSDGEIMLYEKR